LEEGGIHIQNVENRSLYWDIQFIYETDSRFEVVDAQMGSVKMKKYGFIKIQTMTHQKLA